MFPKPSQIRAARTLLGWSAEDLAQKVGVTRKTIERLEDREERFIVSVRLLESVIRAIEAAGVLFVGADDQLGRGVRFRDPTRIT